MHMGEYVIIIDTREKTMWFSDYCDATGIPWKRQKLNYGDYGVEINGSIGKFTVEKKMDLNEIATNFLPKNIERFKREFERSGGNMAVVTVGNYEDIATRKYDHGVHPRLFLSKLRQFKETYGTEFFFVTENTANFIVSLLFEGNKVNQ
jgi:ERCC4-type nuclease